MSRDANELYTGFRGPPDCTVCGKSVLKIFGLGGKQTSGCICPDTMTDPASRELTLDALWHRHYPHDFLPDSPERQTAKDADVALLDAYAATVRAAVMARVRERVAGVFADYRAAYPESVWPDAPFSDVQAASVLRLMLPRIEAAALDAVAGIRDMREPVRYVVRCQQGDTPRQSLDDAIAGSKECDSCDADAALLGWRVCGPHRIIAIYPNGLEEDVTDG